MSTEASLEHSAVDGAQSDHAPGASQLAESPPEPVVRSLTAPLASNDFAVSAPVDDQSSAATNAAGIASNGHLSSSLKEPTTTRRTHSRQGSELIVRDYATGSESAPPSSSFQAVEMGSPFKLSAHMKTSLDSPVVGFEASGPGPLAVSNSPPFPSDPVPTYEASVISPRPQHVSKTLNDVFQTAQDDHARRQRDFESCSKDRKAGAPLWMKLGFIFLAVFVLNFAFVFATVAIVERIENYDDGNGESAQGLLSGIIGTADDRNSSSTQAKAAVLSGLLTTLPAIVGALYAMKLIRKDAANTKRSCTEDQGTREARRLDEVVIVV